MNPFEVPRCPACGAEVTSTGVGMQACAACDHRWVLERAPVERAASSVSGMVWVTLAAVLVGVSAAALRPPSPPFDPSRDLPPIDLKVDLPPLTIPSLPPPVVELTPLSLGGTFSAHSSPPAPAALPKVAFSETSRRAGYLTSFYVVGWVQNDGAVEVDKPKVVAVLHAADGAEVGQSFGFAEADTLRPGERSAIQILVKDPPKHHHLTYEATARATTYEHQRSDALRVEHDRVKAAPGGFGWEVTGKVFNDGDRVAKFAKVEIRAFDAAGGLLGFDTTYVDSTDIAPHSVGRFQGRMLPYGPEPVRWELVPEGRPDL